MRKHTLIASLLGVLGSVGAGPVVSGQSCTIPAPNDHEMHAVWGGDARAVHMADINGARRILVGADGGRLRRSVDGGANWAYVDTPDDISDTLLDIEFLDDDIGFACGRGGQVLKTINGGKSWGDFGNPVLDPCEDAATLWSVHPMTETIVFVAGLWVFKYTVDGGQNWLQFDLYGEGDDFSGTPEIQDSFHFYSIAVSGSLGQFRGAVAAEWIDDVNGENHGVVFHTDASDSQSFSGRRWRVTLDDATYTPHLPGGDDMVEPWGVAFERNSVPGTAIGYVVGGKGGNGDGRIYRTDDGGETWVQDAAVGPTPYDVAVEPGGNVLVGAYSGRYFTRDVNGVWTTRVLPGPADGVATPGESTGSIAAVDSSDADHFVVTGGFGINLQTEDFGENWTEASPFYALDVEEFRLNGVYAEPGDPLTAYAVGQIGLVMKTTNGGCDWTVQRGEIGAGFSSIQEIDFRETDTDKGIAVGAAGSIVYTKNGGDDWNDGVVVIGSAANVVLNDIDLVGTNEAWAVGNKGGSPRVYYSRSHGKTWVQMQAPLQGGLRLEGVVFPESGRGLVVGWSLQGGESTARAYLADFDPFTLQLTWTEVSPVHPGMNPNGNSPNGLLLPMQQKLFGIDADGASLASATVYACGNGGMVLRWNDGTTSFDDVPAVFDVDGNGDLISRELATDLADVSVAPGGGHVLIGAEYDIGAFKSGDLGWMLRFDGSWSRIRALTGKDVAAISLSSSGLGYVVGQTLTAPTDGGRLDHCDGFESNDLKSDSIDHGNLADSIILRYIAN